MGLQETSTRFAYRRSPDQDTHAPVRHPVVIIGAGPVGLSLAIDLAQRDVPVVLLDDSDRIGEGSRAICFAKRTLEIFDRLGVAGPMLEKGVVWQRGRVFRGNAELYDFDLLPEGGHRMPAFVNLQQYYVEAFLVERARALPQLDLRWRNRVAGVMPAADQCELEIETPEGSYRIAAEWVVACDGARSPTRGLLGLPFDGEIFQDRFLIADVKMRADFPTERWFWFDPPFHRGQSALLHRQPDDVWRIDLQLGRDADPAHETKPEIVAPRIAAMLGHDDFDLEWVSLYTFQCRRLARFVHGRVVFAGDAAHQVSPFGARGANSGVQDADNLGWKLAAILRGEADASLIDSYDLERGQAADENIGHSTRSTDFIAPQGEAEKRLRDAVLSLAPHADFARRMVNSGRLSMPSRYDSPLSTPDTDAWEAGPPPGSPVADAPLPELCGAGWLSEAVRGGFTLVIADADLPAPEGIAVLVLPADASLARARLGLKEGDACLIRPDGHVAARFRQPTADAVTAALRRALGGKHG